MVKVVDALVVGTGTAGYTIALALRKAGRRVAVVDNRPYGGTCAMRGCQPKKYLVAAAEIAHLSQQMSRIGIQPVAQIDWPALMKSKSAFTDAVPGNTEKVFQKAGIKLLHGTARFISVDEVEICPDLTIHAEHIVIATGSRTAKLDFTGTEFTITSDEFLKLDHMPRRVAFIGGGYIAMEFAHVAHSAGAAVSVLQRTDRILKRFDAELVNRLVDASIASGISITKGFDTSSIEKVRGSFIVHGSGGRTQSIKADLVVNCAGRVPDLDNLNLEAGKITRSKRGIAVNRFLQSKGNPRVYAIGDACGAGPQLAPVSGMEATIAAANILNGNKKKPDYRGIPSVLFTQPPLALVGITEAEAEAEAEKSGARFCINRGSMSDWPSSRRIGQKHAYYKVIIEEESGRILGAHLFGHNAGEAINIFAMAIKFGLNNQDLKKMLWAYPTNVSDLKYMIG
ncbi:MAG: NAD(P)/FAD-dependent oxidoreductase [Desulfuromonadaceae bacterium]|nr:NAD(P)/FAD-dependent oxidoreductase [Desulfuromonadaceae bacterium]